jgi:hypothetical protein
MEMFLKAIAPQKDINGVLFIRATGIFNMSFHFKNSNDNNDEYI